MDLYTLPPVYSTPSMITPAHYERTTTSPILPLYHSYIYTPISSLSLPMYTLTLPLWDMNIHGNSAYSPSMDMLSMSTMSSSSTNAYYTGISLYRMDKDDTLSPLRTVTLPLRDIAYSAIRSLHIGMLSSHSAQPYVLFSTYDIATYERAISTAAEDVFITVGTSVEMLVDYYKEVWKASDKLHLSDGMNATNVIEKSLTELFLFHYETVLSAGESFVESFTRNVLETEQAFTENDLVSFVLYGMNYLTSHLLQEENILVSDSFPQAGLTLVNEEAITESAASDYDALTGLLEESSVANEIAEWDDFFHFLLSDEATNYVVDDDLVVSAMKLSTTDWSM